MNGQPMREEIERYSTTAASAVVKKAMVQRRAPAAIARPMAPNSAATEARCSEQPDDDAGRRGVERRRGEHAQAQPRPERHQQRRDAHGTARGQQRARHDAVARHRSREHRDPRGRLRLRAPARSSGRSPAPRSERRRRGESSRTRRVPLKVARSIAFAPRPRWRNAGTSSVMRLNDCCVLDGRRLSDDDELQVRTAGTSSRAGRSAPARAIARRAGQCRSARRRSWRAAELASRPCRRSRQCSLRAGTARSAGRGRAATTAPAAADPAGPTTSSTHCGGPSACRTVTPGEQRRGSRPTGAAKLDRDTPRRLSFQIVDRLGRHHPPAADQADPLARALRLPPSTCDDRNTVVSPRCLKSLERLAERLHHQGIEPGGRLVEDQDRRVRHERLDDADLLLHAVRLIAKTAAEIEAADVEALEQLVEIVARHRTAVEPRKVVEISGGREIRIDGELARAGIRSGARAFRLSRWQSTPSTAARPRDGRSRSSSSLIVVVFPAPLAPRKP